MQSKINELKIQNSYPLKTLTLDCQARTMRELLKSGYMITSSDFKKPYKEHFRYIETGTSIENGNVIDGQFCVYDGENFVRQMDSWDFEIKYPIVFSNSCVLHRDIFYKELKARKQ